MNCLYLVGTPIGNLEDISPRALRVLKEAILIAAEDTRKTGRLLKKYAIKTPLISYFEHSSSGRLEHILQQVDKGDVAVVTDAGMPAVSDPGYELVRLAVEKHIEVIPVPGPSAVTAALAVSGLPTDCFYYLGFLPRRPPERRRYMQQISRETATLVAFEAPHRLIASLNDIMQELGDRQIAVCREMTKLHEEIYRGSLAGAIEHFQKPRGEFTLVIAGFQPVENTNIEEEVATRLMELKKAGAGGSAAVSRVASQTGMGRRQVYRAWLELNDNKLKSNKEHKD